MKRVSYLQLFTGWILAMVGAAVADGCLGSKTAPKPRPAPPTLKDNALTAPLLEAGDVIDNGMDKVKDTITEKLSPEKEEKPNPENTPPDAKTGAEFKTYRNSTNQLPHIKAARMHDNMIGKSLGYVAKLMQNFSQKHQKGMRIFGYSLMATAAGMIAAPPEGCKNYNPRPKPEPKQVTQEFTRKSEDGKEWKTRIKKTNVIER